MEKNDNGQSVTRWDEWWEGTDIETQIGMWDFYGLRQYILKFSPRYGRVLEAGSGLGRYVFYLNRFGVNIEGLELSKKLVNHLNLWKKKNDFEKVIFTNGNVTSLPHKDSSLSGYISLGVIEHFQGGPHLALNEAFRVLRSGGIAIITTPSISYYVLYKRILNYLKKPIKKLLGRYKPESFFQYEYRPNKLANFVKNSGLFVSLKSSSDLLYTFCELGHFNGENLKEESFAYRFSNRFENTYLNKLGAQSVVIAIKLDKWMYCFLSGKRTAHISSLKKYIVPISREAQQSELAKYYERDRPTKFSSPYQINPPYQESSNEICSLSGKPYFSDSLFEDFGLNIKVDPKLLLDPEISIKLSNENTQPIWRRNIKIKD